MTQTTLGHYVTPEGDADCAECAKLDDGFPCAVCYIFRDATFDTECPDCAALDDGFPCFDCYSAGRRDFAV